MAKPEPFDHICIIRDNDGRVRVQRFQKREITKTHLSIRYGRIDNPPIVFGWKHIRPTWPEERIFPGDATEILIVKGKIVTELK